MIMALGNDFIVTENLVAGTQARIYATFPDGKLFSMCNFVDFEASQDFSKSKEPILGNPGGGKRKGAPTNKVKGKMYYNNSLFREYALKFQREHKDLYFDMLIVNEDATSTVGRQEVTLKGVNMDSIVVAKFDAAADYLDEDFSATFESWDMGSTLNVTGVREI